MEMEIRKKCLFNYTESVRNEVIKGKEKKGMNSFHAAPLHGLL